MLTTPILGNEVPGDFSRVNPLALHAHAASGHAAAPLRSVMKSRRFTA